jgi:putative transcriptional regulator
MGRASAAACEYFYWVRGLEFWLFTLCDKNELSDLSKKGSVNAGEPLEDRIEDEEVGMKKKRNLMAELTEGLVALADQRTGKRTLRTYVVQTKATPKMSAKELSALRERMNLSRALFAKYLRTNVRTLENWEQGRARPNAQAALLIRMVERYPDTVERLAKI